MSVTPIHTINKKHGGKRTGAGRRVGTGKFGEATTVMRVPASQQPVIKDFLAAYQKSAKAMIWMRLVNSSFPHSIQRMWHCPYSAAK